VLQDLLFAILASLWFLAPLAALFWFNWRAAVFGCWDVGQTPELCSQCLYSSSAPPGAKGSSGFLLGAGVAAWMITFYPMAETFWAVVGMPK
jgi:hypothetical protein